MRFATHDNLLSIQNADPLNGVGEPVVGIAGDEPVSAPPTFRRGEGTGRVKRTAAASGGPALRTHDPPRESFGIGGERKPIVEALRGDQDLDGEFDPGSGRTLAACLIHASRTRTRSLLRGTVANG